MARKSRRNNIILLDSKAREKYDDRIQETLFKTAAYVRLSSESDDERKDTINNQIQYVYQFIDSRKDLVLIDTYVDNGYSGTNFERPEFERMMNDVKTGRIECIVVKDLSRFGRNYLETGLFIENILPKLNVKLLAINDNFDSSRSEDVNSISVPLKNMINEYYAKDMSIKIRASQARRMKDPGKLPYGNAPYGYKKNEDDTQFVINQPYADLVKVIFTWTSLGVPINETAKRLKLAGIDPPGKATGKSGRDAENNKWYENTVNAIITNPIYTGDIVNNKFYNSKITKTHRRIEKDSWIVHSEMHEPIVSRRMFEKAGQKAFKPNKMMKEVADNCDRWFTGKVYCQRCGRKMIACRERKGRSGNTFIDEYSCRPKGHHEEYCREKITEDSLRIIVLKQLLPQIKLIKSLSGRLDIIKKGLPGQTNSMIDKRIQYETSRLEENKKYQLRLYSDYSEGILDLDEYRILKEKNITENNNIMSRLEALTEKRKEYVAKAERLLDMIGGLNSEPLQLKLTKELVENTIEKIAVGENKSIEITFRSTAVVNDLLKELAENENSDISEAFGI